MRKLSALCGIVLLLPNLPVFGEVPAWTLKTQPEAIDFLLEDRAVARYAFRDPKVPRPFFAHMKAPDGTPLTRNFPPVAGRDKTDHPTIHPGIWLAFGDLNGVDFWRNKGRIVHRRFVQEPEAQGNRASFSEEKSYERGDGKTVCSEVFRCDLIRKPAGYFLLWDSTFSAEREIFFGDQEEMGLGVRVATELCELNGGQPRDSERRTTAKEIWGHAPQWCEYAGNTGKDSQQRAGVVLFAHPGNFGDSWLHIRDYGLLAANPFGRKSLTGGEPSRVALRPGANLRLRYGLWLYATPSERPTDGDALRREYLELAEQSTAAGKESPREQSN